MGKGILPFLLVLTTVWAQDCDIQYDTDFFGFDIEGQDREGVPKESQDACANWCCQEDECSFWMYRDGKCWLKTSDEGSVEEEGTVSGQKACGVCPTAAPVVPLPPYTCTDSEPIPVLLEGPHHTVVIESQSYPDFPSAAGLDRCQWKVTALNGAQVRVTALEVELASDCISTSVLSMTDASTSASPLHYPGVEARCNEKSSIPSGLSCLIAEGELVITSTPGVRHRLLLETTVPHVCPVEKHENYCPEGPCCGEEDCVCQYDLGTEALDIQPSKSGLCSFQLIATSGSQVAVNFLEMNLPPTDQSQGCEAWVSLEETGKHLSSVIANQKFCGSIVPNYPAPSVFTSGTNSLTVRYFINEDNIIHGQGFKVAATAVNPLCSAQTYQHLYGESQCTETCGEPLLPPGPQEVDPCPCDGDSCPCVGPDCPCEGPDCPCEGPDCPTKPPCEGPDCPCEGPDCPCEGPDCPCEGPDCPCIIPPKKILQLTIMENGTETAIAGAVVNITSPTSFFPFRSNAEGVVVSEGLLNNATLEISVAAEGYITQKHNVELACENLLCQDCQTSLIVVMDKVPEPCEDCPEPCPDDMTWSVTVITDPDTKTPIEGVKVDLILIVTDGENTTETLVAEDVLTDANGQVNIPITINGDYKAVLEKDNFTSQVIDVTVANCTHEEEEVVLEPVEPPCTGTLEFHVRDHLDTPLPNAKVFVYLPGQAVPVANLTADGDGNVEHEMSPGLVKIKVEHIDYFPKELDVNLTCERGVTRLLLDPVPTTPAPTCYGPDVAVPIVLKVTVFDMLTLASVSGAQVNVSLDNEYTLADEASIPGEWHMTVKRDGWYFITVMADGYEINVEQITIECDPNDCGNCTPSVEVPLEQKVCTDEECCGEDMNRMNVEIRDSNTLALVPGAKVTVEMTVGDGSRSVSPYLACAVDGEVAPDCGYSGIDQYGCLVSECCWADVESNTTSQCSLPVGETEMTTDNHGLVVIPIPGQGEFTITVTREGFEPLVHTFTTTLHPDNCEPITLQLAITQEELCDEDGLPVHLTVLDKSTSLPIPEAIVQVILTGSALGPTEVDVGGSITTDFTGGVSPILYTNGTYRVTVSAAGYLDVSEEFRIPTTACEDGELNITVHLTEIPDPPCDEGTGIDLKVYDRYTGVPVAGILVDITFEKNDTSIMVGNYSTNQDGEARIKISQLGQYVATLNEAGIPPYLAASNTTELICCTCPATIVLYLDQPHCEPVLNITVIDSITGMPISDARVELLLTDSLSGPSLVVEGGIVITDVEGIAALNPEINGNYSVKVFKENYLPVESPVIVDCDPLDCEGCNLQLEVPITEEFCKNRTLELIVKDSTNNKPLEGALAHIVQETHNGPNSVGIFTVDAEGVVLLPLIGNGHYTTTLYAEGFMNMTTTLQVFVTQDQCELLAPMELAPMSPPLEPGCVRISLTWGKKPKDLDLYSYRVEQNNTDDQCLTYYCDGKDPCDGVDFDTDNKEGGDAGSETITYCNVEEYSHMVWVDDRSGLGESLLDSEARLVITADSGESQEVVLRPSEDQETGKRYWLAGCLTTTETSFDFLTLNQFTDASPDNEQPLHCHTRTQLDQNPTTPQAEIQISVANTAGVPLSNVLVSLTTEHETYSKLTGEDGELLIPVTEDGLYSVQAQLENHVPERLNFSLYCEDVEGQCGTMVRVTMLTLEEDGALRIKLNWDGLGRDLDVHLLQVETEEPREVCHTYWNNMGGCDDTELDQNVGMGALKRLSQDTSLAETITVYHFAAKAKYSYLVYVDDNTAAGHDLSLVEPQLTMTQGNKVVSAQMPKLPSAHAGARYWLAGAIEVVGTSFRWVPAVAWFMETPNNKPGITIDNLLDQPTDGSEPDFCDNIQLKVSVMDALTNNVLDATANPRVAILHNCEESGEQEVIAEGAVPDLYGELFVDIAHGGQYEVQVSGAGYVTTKKSVNVDCAPAYCTVCAPHITVPLSPALADDQLRLTLGGAKHLENLDIYAVYRDESTICATTPTAANPTNCPGVDEVTGSDGKGVETITFNQPKGDEKLVYTVFVEWTAPAAKQVSFADSKAWVSLTDGSLTEDIEMKADVYGGEIHWLAGCLLIGSDSEPAFQFRALNAFFTERPDEEMPDLCRETFGLKKKGPLWNGDCVKDSSSRVLPVMFGTTSQNDPEFCIEKCRIHEYSYAGVQYGSECFCGNTPPEDELVVDGGDCDRSCPGDSSQSCGGTWRMNVYETGFDSGETMTSAKNCDCSYKLGGCNISKAPPSGYACHCKYKGWFKCGASIKKCNKISDCPGDCKSKDCCKRGGGNCGGYWWG